VHCCNTVAREWSSPYRSVLLNLFDVAANVSPRLWFLAFVIHNFSKKCCLYQPISFFKKYLSYLGTFRGPPVEKRWFRLASFPIVPFHISVLFPTFSLKFPEGSRALYCWLFAGLHYFSPIIQGTMYLRLGVMPVPDPGFGLPTSDSTCMTIISVGSIHQRSLPAIHVRVFPVKTQRRSRRVFTNRLTPQFCCHHSLSKRCQHKAGNIWLFPPVLISSLWVKWCSNFKSPAVTNISIYVWLPSRPE